MTLCIISSTFPPQEPLGYCGIGDYTHQLISSLATAGQPIKILTSARYAGSPTPCTGVTVYPLIRQWSLSALPQIARFFRQMGITTVHLQYQPDILGRRWSLFNILLAALCQSEGRQLITTMHTISTPSSLSFSKVTARFTALFSSQIIVTNERHEAELLNFMPSTGERCSLIPVGSNIFPSERLLADRASLAETIRKRLRIPRDAQLLASFGRIYPGKGIETLLAALARARHKQPELHLMMLGHVPAGSTSYHQSILNQCHALGLTDAVHWLTDLSEAAVSEYLLAADMYVIAYDDGFSTRRTSGMIGFAHQLPLITTRGSATPTTFRHGQQWLLVPPKDIDALATAIVEVADSKEKRRQLRAAAIEIAQQYGWAAIATRHQSLYQELAFDGK